MLREVRVTAEPLAAYKFTFLHGVRVRSGTNYLGKFMSCNPHIQLVPPKKTTDEFPLMRDMDAWEKAFAAFGSKFTGDKSIFQFSRFLPYFGSAWLAYLIDTFSLHPGHVFLKDPNVQHIDRFFDVFPNAKLLLLVRDGRDNVASSVRAAQAKRRSDSLFHRSKSGLNRLLRRDFFSAATDWSSAIRKIVKFEEHFRTTPWAKQYMILRYEDVYQNPREWAQRIFAFMEVPFEEAILNTVENADVVGSSFYSASQKEDARKVNWTATPKSEAFQPVGRWRSWSPLEKRAFKRIAGRELIRMGYEKSLDWA
jgi:Sulfotransferase family